MEAKIKMFELIPLECIHLPKNVCGRETAKIKKIIIRKYILSLFIM